MSNLQRWDVYAKDPSTDGTNNHLLGFFVDTSMCDVPAMRSTVWKKIQKDHNRVPYFTVVQQVEDITLKNDC